MALSFPRPDEYSGLSELDIYALFADRYRSLPFLPTFNDLYHKEAGLTRLRDGDPAKDVDLIGIVVKGKAQPEKRLGWLPCNPGHFFDDLIAFKREMLINRVLEKV